MAIFIVRFRTGESRGFAFVRYKYADEAQKAVDKLDGTILSFSCLANCLFFIILSASFPFHYNKIFMLNSFTGRVVDGREITVQFAKYGPNAERM